MVTVIVAATAEASVAANPAAKGDPEEEGNACLMVVVTGVASLDVPNCLPGVTVIAKLMEVRNFAPSGDVANYL